MTEDATIHNSQFLIHNSDDRLWRQLKTIPAFRAVLRAVEARFYGCVELPAPVLDVGCGDGHFSQMTIPGRIAAGIDPWWNPLKKSAQAGQYDVLAQAMGDRLPFPDNHFASAFSNSVLEHIPDIQPVLNEVNRVLQTDGRFLITMPSHYFTAWLGGAAFLEKLGADGLAEWYRQKFNGISRHAHTDAPEVWGARLAQAGFEIERWQYYFSKEALRALEIGHAQGIPSAIMHALTGHWIVAPWESSLKWTDRWLRPYYDEPFGNEGAYLLIVARKKADGPIEAALPAARPFTLAELNGQWATANDQLPMVNDQLPTAESPAPTADLNTPTPDHPVTQSPGHPATPLILIGLSLLFAIFGQMAFRDGSGGLGWLLLAAIPLAVLAWRQRADGEHQWQWPRLGDIPERRWWFVSALLLAVLAYRFTAVPGAERPSLGLLLWSAAITLAFFALSDPRRTRRASQKRRSAAKETDNRLPITDDRLRMTDNGLRFTVITTLIFFTTAVALRYFRLSQQPFVLSGIEASLGLNAVEILNGQIRNPFSTAWLTNPTLPLYLTAVPIQLFGQTTLAVRFLSPLVGGLTVAATYLLGERLYGRVVGLGAAILLLGSHLHLHYSHLGMTNIWSPLLVLLALGLTAVAWERPTAAPRQRTLWLAAGLAIGLNAYEFTTARLLPLILLALLAWALLIDRKTLRVQAGHLLAASALALVIALPAILFYRSHPAIFMERVNVLGIMQTGWLPQQAISTGQSQFDLFRQQFRLAALAFNGGADLSPVYKPNVPLLSFGTAVLFLLGFLLSLFRLRQFKFAMLPIWFLVTILFAGALLLDPPQSHRLLIALPAITLLAALALAEIVSIIMRSQDDKVIEDRPVTVSPGHRVTPSPRRLRRLHLVIFITLILAFSEIFFYYGRYPSTNEFADANTEAAHEISQYLNTLEGDWTAYFYGPPVMYTDFPTFPYLLTDFHKGVNFFDVIEPLPTVGTPAPNQVFVFLPERSTDLAVVQQQYPGGVVETVDGCYRSPLFLSYTVPGR
ncbi:MAG: methyltransferase domain-containing protein [Anaerolineae bacterium]|nr:methyltransferase domain-containing protein [Anaerolineae bacterium]